MDQKAIGGFLKELRKEKGFTQEQIAEKLNVSGRTVSRWETGNNMPDISLLVTIADLYDVTIPEIINGERKSEDMREEVKEVAEVMADYAGVEKGKIISDVQKQSIMGVISVVGVMVLELLGFENNLVAEHIHTYFQTLAYVSIFMVFMFSTGLSYKVSKRNNISKLPKALQVVVITVLAFGVAFVLKYLLSAIGL